MKGFHFHAVMPEGQGSKSGSKRYSPFTRKTLQQKASNGEWHNVIAVPLDGRGARLWHGATDFFDVVAPLSECSNSRVESTSADSGYLLTRTVRIDEALARQLHPALFLYIDSEKP